MQADLHIEPVGWGWVTGMFTLSYCLFEIPTCALGDKIGPRRVLMRIVLWWSAFTALTGAVTSYYPLLVTRFFFGAGEAGAFPNASVVVSRWFPPSQRATMCGVTLMASQIGGALAPLLVVPIQSRFGWRASFFVFGALGLVWATVWRTWFRDSPTGSVRVEESPREPLFPWRVLLRSPSVLARRALGVTALACAGLLTIAEMMTRRQVPTVILLSLSHGAITFRQSGVFGVCLDIDKKYAGAMTCLMNTSAQVGGLLGSCCTAALWNVLAAMTRCSCRWRGCCSWGRCCG